MRIPFLSRLLGRRAPAPSRAGSSPEEYSYRGVYSALGYHVVRVSVRDGAVATAGSGKQHERPDRPVLLNLSREFYRDDPFYRGVIDRCAAYAVGNGYALQCRSSNDGWNQQVEQWWAGYWRRPEIRQGLSGPALERMVARELFRAGDLGLVKTEFGTLQLVEAEQIAGPGIQDDGIRRGEYGEPIEYSVAKYRENGGVDVATARKYSPDHFMFVAELDRPSSSRGVPPLSSTFSMLRRINDIFNAEALARQLQARIALSITKEGGGQWGQGSSKPDPSKTAVENDIGSRIQLWDAGLVFTGKPGEKVEPIGRSVPGPQFEQEIIPFFRTVGAAIGIPLEFVYMDWTKTNYSQSRAVIEQAITTFLSWQLLMEDFFHRPTFEWAIERAIARKELPVPPTDDYLAHVWLRPAWPWFDQLKEAQACGEQLDRGLTTHAVVLNSRRIDRGDFLAQRKREVLDGIKTSQEIEKETGVKVDPKIFYGQKPEAPPGPGTRPAPGKEAAPEKADPEEASRPARSTHAIEQSFSGILGEVDGAMVAKGLAGILRSRRKSR